MGDNKQSDGEERVGGAGDGKREPAYKVAAMRVPANREEMELIK